MGEEAGRAADSALIGHLRKADPTYGINKPTYETPRTPHPQMPPDDSRAPRSALHTPYHHTPTPCGWLPVHNPDKGSKSELCQMDSEDVQKANPHQ